LFFLVFIFACATQNFKPAFSVLLLCLAMATLIDTTVAAAVASLTALAALLLLDSAPDELLVDGLLLVVVTATLRACSAASALC